MKESILVRFGRVVRQERIKSGLSQEEFGNICGLHRTYISDIELGKRNVSLENIESIAKAFDIPLSSLFLKIDNDTF